MAILDTDSTAARTFCATVYAISLIAIPISAAMGAPATPYTPTTGRYIAEPDLLKLGFTLPPPPPDAPLVADPTVTDLSILRSIADLDQVRAAQLADAGAKEEAFADADSYQYEALITRFSVASGRSLTITRRPILAHILKLIFKDLDAYSIKDVVGADGRPYTRARPFVIDPSIRPCDQSYMLFPKKQPTLSDSSYPSGHAARGYAAGLLLSMVMPDRGGTILARGIRYGTNRIVCGVHFPTDVAMGQAYGRFIFDRANATDGFKADLDCAMEEDYLDRTGNLPSRQRDRKPPNAVPASTFSAKCQALDATYFKEAVNRLQDTNVFPWDSMYLEPWQKN